MSTAVLVGLLIGVTVAAFGPGTASISRDSSAQRLATRQLAQSLARAVREFSGGDRDKPAITWVRPVHVAAEPCSQGEVSAFVVAAPVRRLRVSLLSLPPPRV